MRIDSPYVKNNPEIREYNKEFYRYYSQVKDVLKRPSKDAPITCQDTAKALKLCADYEALYNTNVANFQAKGCKNEAKYDAAAFYALRAIALVTIKNYSEALAYICKTIEYYGGVKNFTSHDDIPHLAQTKLLIHTVLKDAQVLQEIKSAKLLDQELQQALLSDLPEPPITAEQLKERIDKCSKAIIEVQATDSPNKKAIMLQLHDQQKGYEDQLHELQTQQTRAFVANSVRSSEERSDAQHAEFREALAVSGTFSKADINARTEALKTNPAALKYFEVFYWTMIGTIEAYSTLGSGVVQGNVDHEQTYKGLAGETAANIGYNIGRATPIISTAVSVVGAIIKAVYRFNQERELQAKVKVINDTMASYFTSHEQRNFAIQEIAITLAEDRGSQIIGRMVPPAYQVITRAISQLNERVYNIKIGDNSAHAVLATEDAATVLMCLLTEHEAIMSNRTRTLHDRLTSCILKTDCEALKALQYVEIDFSKSLYDVPVDGVPLTGQNDCVVGKIESHCCSML